MAAIRKYSRRHRRRNTYVPQRLRISSVKRPLASKYGDELHLKIQKVLPMRTVNAGGDVYFYMRQDSLTGDPFETNICLGTQPELDPFIPLYGFYEVVGMKAEMSCSATSNVTGAGLFAGMAPGLVNPSGTPAVMPAPTNDNLVKLPIQTKGNTQGEVFTIYYAFSNDLKKQGA